MCGGATAFYYGDIPEGYIRVLDVLSEPDDRDLCLNLHVIDPRSDLLPYYAISHTWTVPLYVPKPFKAPKPVDLRQSILCNGQRMYISGNLVSALRSVQRLCARDRRYWVDAICIDQTDDAEKSKQVKHIDQVFKYAKGVLIWLGVDSHGSGKVMKFIPKLRRILMHIPARVAPDEEYLSHFQLPKVGHPIWGALGRFWNRPWFRRVWIVQEVGLANRSKTRVLCGHKHLPFQYLLDLDRLLIKAGLHRLLSYQLSNEDERLFWRTNWEVLQHAWSKKVFHLSDLWLYMRTLECELHVDRVFGVLGLFADKFRSQIDVDYSEEAKKHHWKLYLHIAKLALRHEPGLRILQYAVSVWTHELPSWCPDLVPDRPPKGQFSHRQEMGFSYFATPDHLDNRMEAIVGYQSAPNASAQFPRDVQPSPGSERLLTVAGTVIDVIDKTIDPAGYRSAFAIELEMSNDQEVVRKAPHASESIELLTRLQSLAYEAFHPSGMPYPDRFRRLAETLVGFVPCNYLPKNFSCADPLGCIMDIVNEDWEEHWKDLSSEERSTAIWYSNSMASLWYGKVFFSTKSGKIGLASSMVEEGDTVVVLFGGSTRFVLRKNGSKETWTFLQSAYLHGYMQGEVFPLLRKGKLKKEMFTLV